MIDYIKETIPNTEQEVKQAIVAGWEVYAYSEYGKSGIPSKAEIRKPKMEQSLEDYQAERALPC